MRPISKEQKEFQGTYEPSKEGLEPIQLTSYERNPPPPANWPPDIKKLWNELCTELKKAGYLMKLFIPALESYCYAIMQRNEAHKELLSGGFVVPKTTTAGVVDVPSPWLTVLKDANKEILNFGAKYGLTPLDVQKIPAVRKDITNENSLLK